MSKQSKTNLTGWHRNTDLGCDLKTILCSDRRMKQGKDYQGVLRLDDEGTIDEYLTTRYALHVRRDAALDIEA